MPLSHALRRLARQAPLLALGLAFGSVGPGCSTTFDGNAHEWDGNLDDEGTGGATGGESGEGTDEGADDSGPGGSMLVPYCDADANSILGLDPTDGNAQVSPARARAAILAGDGSLAQVAIAPREFLNYYGFDYPSAEAGELAVAAELHLSELDTPTAWILQIGVNGQFLDPAARPPANLALVLDASAAASPGDLELVKAGAQALVASLHPGDRISVVRLGHDIPVLIDAYEVEAMDDPYLLDAIASLELGADADLELGLTAAYERAEASFGVEWINRVVYIGSDLTGLEVIPTDIVMSHAGMPGDVGILFVGAGVGDPGAYDRQLIQELADVGHGTSLFLGDAQEAWRALHLQFMSTLAVAARDVSVHVELPPGFRPAGADEAAQAATPYADAVPEDLAANRPLVFHERLESCAADKLDATSPLRVEVAWHDPLTFEARETTVELNFGQAMQSAPSRMLKGRAVMAYADGLLAWQADDATLGSAAIGAAVVLVDEARLALPEDEDLLQIAELLAILAY